MCAPMLKYGLMTAALVIGFGLTSAEAFVGKLSLPGTGLVATPAAMCGYSCRSGGRYIPGPPSVCYDRGMEYCGSSRDAGPPVVRREFYRPDDFIGSGRREEFRDRCQTTTIQRADGSVRTIRRCD